MDQTIGWTFKATDKTGAVVSKLTKELAGIGVRLRTITRRGKAADSALTQFFKRGTRGAQQLTQSLTTVSIAVMGAHHAMSRVVDTVVGGFARVAGSGIEAAANVQESNLRLDFSLSKIGKNAEVVKAKIDALSLRTVLTRRELSDMVSGLAIQKIDAFDASLDDLFVTMADGSKQGISAMEILNDAVAFSGKTVQRIMFTVKEAASEQNIRPNKELAQDLNLSKRELVTWNKALKSTKSNQEAFNVLMQLMADRVGGSTLAIGSSLNFVLKQVPDWIDKLGDILFRDAVPLIANFVRTVGDLFIQMVTDDSFKPIRDSITTTVDGMMMLSKVILIVVRGIVGLFEKVPALVPIITGLGLMAVAAAGFLLVLTGVMGPLLAFAGLAALLPTLLGAWAPILGAMILMVPLLLAVVSPFAAMVALAGAFLGMHVKAKSFTEFWEKLQLIIGGVVEGIKNLREGTTRFSAESAAEMEKAGVLDTVISIVTWFDRMVVVIDEAKLALKGMWPEFRKAMEPVMGAIIDLAEVLGVDLAKGLDTSMSTAEKRGRALGNVLKVVALTTIRLMTLMLQIATKIAGFLGIDTTSDQPGSTDAFNALTQEQRENAVEQGVVPVTKKTSFFGVEKSATFNKRIEDLTEEDKASNPNLQGIISSSNRIRASRQLSKSGTFDQLMSLFPETLDGQKPQTSKDVASAATGVSPVSTAQNSTQPPLELSDSTIERLSTRMAEKSDRLTRRKPLEVATDPDSIASGVEKSAAASAEAGN